MFKVFKQKLLQQEQGFTLVEVLVAILVSTVFITVSLQAVVLSAVLKARAKQSSAATTWIQEDLENVRHRASQLQYTSLITAAAAAANATAVLQVTPVLVGFQAGVGNTVVVGSDPTTRTITSISSANATPRTITLSAAATPLAQPVGAVVAGTDKCNPPINAATGLPNQGLGFAGYLRNNLPTMSSDPALAPRNTNQGTKRIAGQMYILSRYGPLAGSTTPNVSDTALEIMELKYEVKPNGGGNAIATMYTEVIPNAAFKCP